METVAAIVAADAAAHIEFIGRYIDDEITLSEPSALMTFLDIYTGIMLRELEGMGIAVPLLSVYDPRAVKEVKAALQVIAAAINAISEVLDDQARRLNHDQMRDLLMQYVSAVCDYYESSGTGRKITLHALAATEAAEAFNASIHDFNPGDKMPRYFVENVIGLR
ncbi:MAG: hypothetical protein L7F77_13330 [Candidatus Magnetominusculus sp. LBB02]|nr:hypothetical protein [Candidatus Magnetominusculus sp. LBB02]